jgi:TonB family protein
VVIVSADGTLRNIRVEKPLGKGLDEKAIEALRQWKFKPAMKNGQPVAVLVKVDVRFWLGKNTESQK